MSQLALQLFTMHQFKCIYHFQNSTISVEIGKTMGFNYQCMTQVLKIALPRRENKGINVHIPEPSPNLIVAEDDKHIVVVSDQGDCLGVPERIRGLEEIFVSQGCDSTSCFSNCVCISVSLQCLCVGMAKTMLSNIFIQKCYLQKIQILVYSIKLICIKERNIHSLYINIFIL